RNAPSFLREAKRSQAENHPENAVEYFRRYVKLAPRDTEALILYGFQLADLNRLQGAYLTLDKAIRLLPDRTDVRRRLTELAIHLQRYSDAMNNLNKYLLKEWPDDKPPTEKAKLSKENAELLEQRSLCHYAEGDFKKADQDLTWAIKNAPDRLE